MPMWPITGGVIGAALVSLALGSPHHMPDLVSTLAQLLVGTAVGTAIGTSIFKEFAHILVPGIVSVLAVVGLGFALGLALSALGLLPTAVAILGLVPGGVGEMVAAAITLHTDSATVAGIHLVRLLAVIWFLPLLMQLARKMGGTGRDQEEE